MCPALLVYKKWNKVSETTCVFILVENFLLLNLQEKVIIIVIRVTQVA